MDEPTEEAFETNWVFVEDVDVAEEALNLSSNTEEFHSSDIFETVTKNIKKSYSDSHLLNQVFKETDDKQITDLDSESDGLSIISNWSYSQGTPDSENFDDSIENKEINRENQINDSIKTIQINVDQEASICAHEDEFIGRCEEIANDGIDEQQNGFDELRESYKENCNAKYLLTSKDNIDDNVEETVKDNDEFHKSEEVDYKSEEPSHLPERSFPELSEERVLRNESDLLDQLRWLDEPPESREDTSNENVMHKLMISKVPQCIKKHFSISGFLIGTVLIAASSVFLGRYFTATETTPEEVPTYNENVFLYDVPSEENFDVPTALSFCREKHKSDDIYMEINAQKCLNKIEKRIKRKRQDKMLREKVKSLEKELELKEQYLTEKEKSLMKLKQGTQFSAKDRTVGEKGEFMNDFKKMSKNYINDDLKEKISQRYDYDIEKESTTKEVHHHHHQKYFDDDFKRKLFKEDKKKKDKLKIDDDSKGEKVSYDDSKKNRYKSYDENNKKSKVYKEKKAQFQVDDDYKTQSNIYDDMKGDKYEIFDQNYKKGKDFKYKIKTTGKDLKFPKSENKKKYGEHSSEERSSKIEKKKNTSRQGNDSFCRHSKSDCKNSKNKNKQKYVPNFLLLDRKNETVDGSWLGRLFKGREELRDKDKSGEWYFDRSSYRKRKRDKSTWYFDWMMDRELMRYRRFYI